VIDSETRRQLEGCAADCVSMLLQWMKRVGATAESTREGNRVISRLLRCSGEYWQLSGRDDALIEDSVEFHIVRNGKRTHEELENMRRRVYIGGLATDNEATQEQLQAYFAALGTAPRSGRPGDIARIERVAHEIRALTNEGLSLWRPTKPNAWKYKNEYTPETTLTDEARTRLSIAYANGSDLDAISRKDLINCIKRAENVVNRM